MEKNITGACGPFIIHSDPSKTKEKEAEEREKYRNGATPTLQDNIAARFLEHLENIPELHVATLKSGSMTQEIFFEFCKHFIKNKDEGPCILLLDGHASRWSVQALKMLMDNQVFPFFIASHTSTIWAQPNDGGSTKGCTIC